MPASVSCDCIQHLEDGLITVRDGPVPGDAPKRPAGQCEDQKHRSVEHAPRSFSPVSGYR